MMTQNKSKRKPNSPIGIRYPGLNEKIARQLDVSLEYVSRVRHGHAPDTPKCRDVKAAIAKELRAVVERELANVEAL